MINQLFEKIKRLNLDDFGILYTGYIGIPEYGCLENTTVNEYVVDYFDKYFDQSISDSLMELLLIDEDTPRSEVTNLLGEVVDILKIDISVSTRKWLLICLDMLLNNINQDPIYGLLELSNFWMAWGQPKDSPHNIQGVNNEISVSDYYTLDNYELMIRKNREWLNYELEKYSLNINQIIGGK